MSWGARRQFLILAIIGTLVLIVIVGALYTNIHHAPSCVDGIQNQGEAGIDCGGPCPYLCQSQVQAPVVDFTQSLPTASGMTDVIAYINNPNQDAYARGVTYQVSLYALNHTLAAPIIDGSIDLPPGATIPVFIPNISSGATTVTSAFLVINSGIIKWQAGRDTRIIPTVTDEVIGGTIANPHITATLTDPSAEALSGVKVIIAVYDAEGNIIAASQTIVPNIPGQGSASATFTWNAAFPATPTRVEIVPLIPLP